MRICRVLVSPFTFHGGQASHKGEAFSRDAGAVLSPGLIRRPSGSASEAPHPVGEDPIRGYSPMDKKPRRSEWTNLPAHSM
jgi:hypothetical protein